MSIVKGPTKPRTPSLLHKLFEKNAAGPFQSNTALIFKENETVRETSYKDLNITTNRMARTIQKIITRNNLPKNQDGDYLVAVYMHRTDHLVAALLAILKAGAAYLPLHHDFPGTWTEYIFKDAKPVLTIHDQGSTFHMDTHKVSYEEVLEQSNNEASTTLADNETLKHDKDNLAVVIYTSGSTGIPKGVRLTHEVIQNRLQWQFERFPYSSTEKVCVYHKPLIFADGIGQTWGPLLNGLTVLVAPKVVVRDPKQFVELLEHYKIERLVEVPSPLHDMLKFLESQNIKHRLKSMKLVVCSGESLTVSLARQFYEYFPANKHVLCNFYGGTETMGDVTYYIVPGLEELKHMDKVPIGVPLDNTTIYLLDEQHNPVECGHVGEVFVSGFNVAAGYVGGREADRFLDNNIVADPGHTKLFRTGDYARMEQGQFIYEGRTDSQIKVRGQRVDLTEVKRVLESVEGVQTAVVLCSNPGEMNQVLLAFLTTTISMNSTEVESMLKKKNKLSSYMIPQIIVMERIPLLINGKIDRQALLQHYESTSKYTNGNVR